MPLHNDAETIEVIREHNTHVLRYCAWALRRIDLELGADISGEPILRDEMFHHARIVAIIEGARGSRAIGIKAHEEIIPRFLREAEDEGWKPRFEGADEP